MQPGSLVPLAGRGDGTGTGWNKARSRRSGGPGGLMIVTSIPDESGKLRPFGRCSKPRLGRLSPIFRVIGAGRYGFIGGPKRAITPRDGVTLSPHLVPTQPRMGRPFRPEGRASGKQEDSVDGSSVGFGAGPA